MGDTVQKNSTGFEERLASLEIFDAEMRASNGVGELVFDGTKYTITSGGLLGNVDKDRERWFVSGANLAATLIGSYSAPGLSITDTMDSLIPLANAMLADIKRLPKNILLQQPPSNECFEALAKVKIYAEQLQRIASYMNNIPRAQVDRQQFQKMDATYTAIDKAFKHVGLSKHLSYPTTDARAVADVLKPNANINPIGDSITAIIDAYNLKKGGTGYGHMRQRFAERRDAQLFMLNSATRYPDSAEQMAILLAVYKSLKSETITGEKARFFGKSSLETIIEKTLLEKHGINIKKYDHISTLENASLKTNFKPEYAKYNNKSVNVSEMNKILDHLGKVTAKPVPKQKGRNLLKQ